MMTKCVFHRTDDGLWCPFLFCYVTSCHQAAGQHQAPANKHCTALLRGGAHNCFLLHFRIKGCRNLQYISTFNLALSGTATVKPVNEWMEFRQKGRTASQLCPTRSLALCVHKFKIANSSDLIWNQVVQKQEVKELGRKLLAFPVDQIDQSEFICEERGKGRICTLWISDQSSQTYL